MRRGLLRCTGELARSLARLVAAPVGAHEQALPHIRTSPRAASFRRLAAGSVARRSKSSTKRVNAAAVVVWRRPGSSSYGSRRRCSDQLRTRLSANGGCVRQRSSIIRLAARAHSAWQLALAGADPRGEGVQPWGPARLAGSAHSADRASTLSPANAAPGGWSASAGHRPRTAGTAALVRAARRRKAWHRPAIVLPRRLLVRLAQRLLHAVVRGSARR